MYHILCVCVCVVLSAMPSFFCPLDFFFFHSQKFILSVYVRRFNFFSVFLYYLIPDRSCSYFAFVSIWLYLTIYCQIIHFLSVRFELDACELCWIHRAHKTRHTANRTQREHSGETKRKTKDEWEWELAKNGSMTVTVTKTARKCSDVKSIDNFCLCFRFLVSFTIGFRTCHKSFASMR